MEKLRTKITSNEYPQYLFYGEIKKIIQEIIIKYFC